MNLYKQRIGIKGRQGAGMPLNMKTSTIREYGIPLQILGVNEGKQQIMTRLGIENKGPQYFHFPLDDHALGNRGYDQIYFRGLISERRKISFRGGQIHVEWEPVDRVTRNEPLDLRVYNLACIQSFPKNWRKLADMMGVELPPDKEKPPAEAPAPQRRQGLQMRSRSLNLY